METQTRQDNRRQYENIKTSQDNTIEGNIGQYKTRPDNII